MKKMQGLALLLLVSMFASACGQNQEVENTILIAYFSRYGNTDYPEDVDATTSASIVVDNGTFGTTEYLARMIQEKTGGDLHLIETVTGYTTDFEELTDVNHNEVAEEFKEKLPITVSMVGYGGREYYGGIDFTPVNAEGGQLNFENGDITYCSTNNSMAIFYAQTDRPDLTMEVIPIGKVTSDLAVFDTFSGNKEITFRLVE